ncbi:MAG: PHP domain-containing protein [Anaerolineales bacterium]|nr:PHP domain-containing protein [Anaerolineales bacterium]
MPKLIRLENHAHTIYSKDSLTKLEDFIATCRKRGIDRVVITDHNNIKGALKAREMAPDLVIVGEEIMTRQGEFLAAYVEEEIPKGLDKKEALERLEAQGAFISVSHPFDEMRNGHWRRDDLIEVRTHVDAIEVFNARVMRRGYNEQAQAFAEEFELLGTVGSDAHTARELGRAVQVLPEFEDADGLREAIRHARFETRLSSPLIHFTSRYAVWRKALSRG